MMVLRKILIAENTRAPLTYCGYKSGSEGVVTEPKQNAGFSHSGVPNQQQFKQ